LGVRLTARKAPHAFGVPPLGGIHVDAERPWVRHLCNGDSRGCSTVGSTARASEVESGEHAIVTVKKQPG